MTTPEMRILTVRQPWAWAIALAVVILGGLLAAVVAVAAHGIAVFVKWRDERKKRGGGR